MDEKSVVYAWVYVSKHPQQYFKFIIPKDLVMKMKLYLIGTDWMDSKDTLQLYSMKHRIELRGSFGYEFLSMLLKI